MRESGARDSSKAGASPWAPFWHLVRLCLLISALTIAVAYAWLWRSGAPMRWELLVAVAGGVAGTLMLTGVLMGLVFVSNRSGHDADVGQGDQDRHP